jgi:hypothetical protein
MGTIFEVHTAVLIKIEVIWGRTPCRLANKCRCFGRLSPIFRVYAGWTAQSIKVEAENYFETLVIIYYFAWHRVQKGLTWLFTISLRTCTDSHLYVRLDSLGPRMSQWLRYNINNSLLSQQHNRADKWLQLLGTTSAVQSPEELNTAQRWRHKFSLDHVRFPSMRNEWRFHGIIWPRK